MAAAFVGNGMRWSHAELRNCRPNDVVLTTEVIFVVAINSSGLFGNNF